VSTAPYRGGWAKLLVIVLFLRFQVADEFDLNPFFRPIRFFWFSDNVRL